MNLVLVEHVDGAATDVSLQALTLAAGLGGETHALVIGPGGTAAAASVPAAVVHVAEHDALDAFAPDAWASVLCGLAEQIGATAVVAPGTGRATDAMARAAVRLGEPLAANCISVTQGDPLLLTRVRWGGSLLEEARLHAGRALLTVAPHAVAPVAAGAPGSVETFTPEIADADLVVRVRDRVAPPAGGVSLADAKVVVTGGRGVGSAEGFVVVEELAGLLGGAVGCSRAVTMSGWRPHTDQVGQTGNKIAPEIYIACGVSGATQHIAGAKGAKKILAVNTDPEAPIMSIADYAVVGDLHEVLPAVSAELRRRRG
ncbi:electron transfer flavoprotein subunit alpha/FixB family protein [Gaiella sp.]|uniref:electron transfer flavoprotein subunit alpha/FixB family protein n=1 Tax=Gaiella sp. TaxID=2663207 RepID=UPI00326703DD